MLRLRGNSNKRWRPEDDRQLLELLKAEASWALIAATLKRRFSAVRYRAWKLKRSNIEQKK